MAAFLQYKWLILVCFEVLAWISTFFMLYARYAMKSQGWFRIGVIAFMITGVIPQVVLGIVNFLLTKKLDLFTLIIILLILYGATIGKKNVKKLDLWAKNKFSKQAK